MLRFRLRRDPLNENIYRRYLHYTRGSLISSGPYKALLEISCLGNLQKAYLSMYLHINPTEYCHLVYLGRQMKPLNCIVTNHTKRAKSFTRGRDENILFFYVFK